MSNAWQSTDSWWNPPKLLYSSFTLLLSMAQRLTCRTPPPSLLLELRQGGGGQSPCYKLVAYVWNPDKYLRHLLTQSMPSHTCGNSPVCEHCVRASSIWFTAKPKKQRALGHPWSFLTGSGNSINAPTYQQFHLFKYLFLFCPNNIFHTDGFSKSCWSFSGRPAVGLHNHLVVWTFSTTGGRDQYNSDQFHLDYVLPKYIWQTLKQPNSDISSSSIPSYLPLSRPDGIALAPYDQMVWLQSASSICPVSWMHAVLPTTLLERLQHYSSSWLVLSRVRML